MSGFIDGRSINGAGLPNWVKHAVVSAVAGASLVSAPAVRTTYASALGNAAVSVTLTQTDIHAAQASASSSATATLNAHTIYAGRVSGAATSVAYASVFHHLYGAAAGQAGATGTAIVASRLGNVSATAGGTAIQAKGHLIRPGASSAGIGTSAGVGAAGKVTRYPTVSGALATATSATAEARYKPSGSAHYQDQGYVRGVLGTCTASVSQALTRLIVTGIQPATQGSTSGAKAFVHTFAFAAGVTAESGGAITNTGKVQFGAIAASAGASSVQAVGVRVKMPTASVTAAATGYTTVGRVNRVSLASASAGGSAVSIVGVRKAYAGVSATFGGSTGTVGLPGAQYRGGVLTSATSTFIAPTPLMHYAGHSLATGSLVMDVAAYGQQNRGTVLGSAGASAVSLAPKVNYRASAQGTGTTVLSFTRLGAQNKASATSFAGATGVKATGTMVHLASTFSSVLVTVRKSGTINGAQISYSRIEIEPTAISTATAIDAFAVLGADKLAPVDRYMDVPFDDRLMAALFDDRTMVVPA